MGASPVWWKCGKCNRKRDHNDFAVAGQPVPTGRIKGNITNPHVQYKCGYCEHVGWSKHLYAHRLFIRMFPDEAVKSGLFSAMQLERWRKR